MWFLLMVIMAPGLGADREVVIEHYPTQEACRIERNRIGFEMAKAYPWEMTFRIECEWRERARKWKA
jgi:elongation factor P--beta-lysine ligase